MKLVSACLLGIKCNFEASAWAHTGLLEEFAKGGLYPVCPEVLGGLPIPRTPAEIQGGTGADVIEGTARVVAENGVDVTAEFLRGAQEALKIARTIGASEALLTERSPSCGCGLIFDGTFSFTFKKGDGVTAALLKKNGITVTSIIVKPDMPQA
jgi:uncharacterized protein YbbK (DUF523 family)